MFAPSNCERIVSKRQKQQNQSLLTILVPIIKSLKPLGLRIFFTIVYSFTIKKYFSHDVTDLEQCIMHKSFLLSHRLWFLLLFVAKQDEIIGYNNIAIKVIKILHCYHQICFIFDILHTVLHTTRIRWVWSLMNKICLYSMSDRSRSRHYRTPYVSVKRKLGKAWNYETVKIQEITKTQTSSVDWSLSVRTLDNVIPKEIGYWCSDTDFIKPHQKERPRENALLTFHPYPGT